MRQAYLTCFSASRLYSRILLCIQMSVSPVSLMSSNINVLNSGCAIFLRKGTGKYGFCTLLSGNTSSYVTQLLTLMDLGVNCDTWIVTSLTYKLNMMASSILIARETFTGTMDVAFRQ